jgi:hypothetical protein
MSGERKHYSDEALAAAGIKPASDADKTTSNGDGKQSAKTKQADLLIAFAAQAKLFHSPSPDNDAFADIIVNGHRETHPVRGRTFRQWLRHQYFNQMKRSCSSDAMQEAVETIAAKAQFEVPRWLLARSAATRQQLPCTCAHRRARFSQNHTLEVHPAPN